jgi:two-component system, NtrC family, sensor histidine kinase AtoS
MKLTTRILILVFLSVLIPILALSFFVKEEITKSILREKEDKLFGLAKQLDEYLEGTFDDILREKGALGKPREEKIAVLNERLWTITDFVASGNAGVGVGYYDKDLDAIVTYGPSLDFQYMVGQRISATHKGREVMATGKPLVQQGFLVRGNILNCMWPIVRGGQTIGYIWSNETLDQVSRQLTPILQRVYGLLVLIFVLIYASVTASTQTLLDKIYKIKKGIEVLFDKPTYHIPPISGELSIIVETINELVDNMNLIKCYNKNILEGVFNGVLAVSLDGRISRANKAFYQLFPKLSDESLLGRDFRDVFDRNIQNILRVGIEVPGYHPATEVLLSGKRLEIYGNSMIDEAGVRLGAVFVFRDVTMVRKYDEEVKEKERAVALGEMALGVVHEVKNPLTSVKGFAQLLTRPEITEEKRTEYARLIDSELNRVNRLLNEMLVYGGQSRLDRQKCDILAILANRLDGRDWSDCGGRPEIRVCSGDSFVASVDELKITQVFDNVLKNAQEAIAAKGEGRVVVLARADGRKIDLAFLDTGCGIRPDDLGKTGNPLFSTKRDGTGLGLAISRKIIEAHGGSLAIQSRYGFYTKVSMRLPRTGAAKAKKR